MFHDLPLASAKGEAMSGSASVHVQFCADHPEELATFYNKLFGWTSHPVTISDPTSGMSAPYLWLELGGPTDVSAGITALENRSPTVIVGVDDVLATLSRAEELGGRRLQEPTHLELTGLASAQGSRPFGAIGDPAGNFIGLIQR
jgi:predicted enzyme related to lactoylglutathione lyase